MLQTFRARLCGVLNLLVIVLSGCGPLLGRGLPPTPTIVALTTSSPPTATAGALPTKTPLPLPSPTSTPTLLSVVILQLDPTPTAQPQPRSTEPLKASNQPSAPTLEQRANNSLTGVWNFSFGTMNIEQRHSAFEGRFHWYGGGDTGRIEGNYLADLRQIRGLWISDRDPVEQGFVQARLSSDGAEFLGTYARRSLSGLWCGVRSGSPLAPGCGFSGVWQLRYGSPPNLVGQATLTQTGEMVRGTFTATDGRSGEIDGQVVIFAITEARLTGFWRDNRGETDTFEWRLDLTTGRTFTGRRNPGNSEWCGWQSGAETPDPCGW